jgi:hypothetical protein
MQVSSTPSKTPSSKTSKNTVKTPVITSHEAIFYTYVYKESASEDIKKVQEIMRDL